MDEISYRIQKSKRAKRIRVTVYCDGQVVVTSPAGLDQKIVERFFAAKQRWVQDKIRFFQGIQTKAAARKFTQQDYQENKGRALELVKSRLQHFNQFYGHAYHRISIKNQTSRWGSCSRKGNLNFNYKIAFLPAAHQDYIVVHELCHLKEFNHSKRFWNLVAKTIPNYQHLKKDLFSHEFLFS